MQSIEIAKPPAGFPTPDRAGILRSWIGDRRVLAVAGLAVAGLAVAGTGLALGWNWLTAVGIAPLIASAAPCLIMCALGLCMMGRSQPACSSQPAQGAGELPTRTDPPAAP
jgi:hypothetical protein